MTLSAPLPEQPEFSSGGFVKAFEEDKDSNSLVLEVLSLTPEYLEKDLIKEFYQSLEGKEIRWRHVQPELFTGSFLGTTLKTWLDDSGNLMSHIKIDGDTEEQKKAQKWIKEQFEKEEKVGVSVGFIRIMDDDEKTTKVFFREQSITPFPHCDECGVVKIVTNEDKDKEVVEAEELANIPLGTHLSLEPGFEGSFTFEGKKDKEEKEGKDEKDKEKEEKEDEEDEKDKEKEEMQDEKKDGKGKNDEKELKQLESSNKQLKSQVKEYEKALVILKDKVIELEVEKEIRTSEPKRKRIAELEGFTDPRAISKRMDELLDFDDRPGKSGKSNLDLMLESLERATKASAKTGQIGTAPDGVVTSPLYPGSGKLTSAQLEKMSPEEILKSANFNV
jgi:hypothetical protein